MRLNVIFAVLAVVILAAFAVLYFVIAGGSGDEAENGLSVEDQSPRIEQNAAETPTQTADETSAPERQEEAPVYEDAEAEESAAPSGESAGATQPDAPQAAPQDPFTLELQEGVDEMNDIVQRMLDRFPNSKLAEISADLFSDLGSTLMRYDAELSRQSLTREERIAKLKQRAEEVGKRFEEEMESMMAGFDPMSEDVEAVSQFLESNEPKKLTQLLGL